ncbi:MAG: site-specific integrase, partial [Candidatus Obscuribacterales bacterium]
MNSQRGALVWLDQFAGYLEMERNYSSNTIRAYVNDLKQLITNEGAEGTKEVLDFTPEEKAEAQTSVVAENQSAQGTEEKQSSAWMEVDGLRSYIRQIQESYSRPTVARKISAIRSFYRYLKREQLIDDDPSKLVRGPKLSRRLPACLDREEVTRLLLAPDDSSLGVRDRALMEVLYASGMRVSELCGLRI